MFMPSVTSTSLSQKLSFSLTLCHLPFTECSVCVRTGNKKVQAERTVQNNYASARVFCNVLYVSIYTRYMHTLPMFIFLFFFMLKKIGSEISS